MIQLTVMVVAFVVGCNGQISLEQYNIDPNSITVSGIFSGAAMATQFHVAHSASIMGAGMVAGVPYYCAQNFLAMGLACMSTPSITSVNLLITQTNSFAATGQIDATTNMMGSKVYLFAGTIDSVIHPGNSLNMEKYYKNYGAQILSQYAIDAEHSFPTESYEAACDFLGSEYINDCNHHTAFFMMDFFYGGLSPPASSLPGVFDTFDQSEYFYVSLPAQSSMDNTGYVYIPSGCVSKVNQCKLHIAFHGCQQGRYLLGDSFARNTGYLEVAEANNIIVLFPQVVAKALTNPKGCWDWWGYTNALYPTTSGNQILAVYRMLKRLVYGL